MAVESLNRWRIIREITIQKESGVLTLQLGRNYLSWNLQSGSIVTVNSTIPEFTFSHFLLSEKVHEHELQESRKLVSDHKTLGAVLVERNIVTVDKMQELLFRHAVLTCELLFRCSSVFWNSSAPALKRYLIPLELPFSDALMRCDHTDLETQPVLHLVNGLQPPLRITSGVGIPQFLTAVEKKVFVRLQSSASVKEILRDPELDTFTCYRTLFLLWIAGALADGRNRTAPKKKDTPNRWTLRIRSLPPDWIIPLIAGTIIGAILSPSSAPTKTPASTYHIEPIQKALERPSWKDTKEKNSAQNRDDGK